MCNTAIGENTNYTPEGTAAAAAVYQQGGEPAAKGPSLLLRSKTITAIYKYQYELAPALSFVETSMDRAATPAAVRSPCIHE